MLCTSKYDNKLFLLKGALIQGLWYVHILSLLACMCLGTCTYYMQPLVFNVWWFNRTLSIYAHTSLLIIKFRGCLETASERTNVPLISAQTWTPFHHPLHKGWIIVLFCWIKLRSCVWFEEVCCVWLIKNWKPLIKMLEINF